MVHQELIRKMKLGDLKAFDAFFEMYHSGVYNFCIHLGLNHEDAQETAQDVFIKVYNNREKLDASKNVQSYLLTITKNAVYDAFRIRMNRKAAEDYQIHLLHAKNDTEELLAYSELEELIRNKLKQFPHKRRLIFELSRFEGLTNREIANEMGVSIKTVEAHISAALQEFQSLFRQADIIGIALILSAHLTSLSWI